MKTKQNSENKDDRNNLQNNDSGNIPPGPPSADHVDLHNRHPVMTFTEFIYLRFTRVL